MDGLVPGATPERPPASPHLPHRGAPFEALHRLREVTVE